MDEDEARRNFGFAIFWCHAYNGRMIQERHRDSKWIKPMRAQSRRCLLGIPCLLLLGVFVVLSGFSQASQEITLHPEELEKLKSTLIQERVLKESVSPEAFQHLELKEIRSASTRAFYLLPLYKENAENSGREGEFLLPNLFYSQLGNFYLDEAQRLLNEWNKASELRADALLLDLRTDSLCEDPLDFIPILEAFVPSGTVLFRSFDDDQAIELYVSQAEPFWKGALHVLIDEESSASAKFLASLLHLHAGAQLFGKLEVEEIYSFASIPLSERNRVLLSEFQLRIKADNTPLAQASPAVLPLDSDVEGKKLWRDRPQQTLKSLLFEVAPERGNEKSLLERQDPELDFRMQLDSSAQREAAKQDITLIQAIDLLAAQRFLKPAKIALPVSLKGGNMFEFSKDP